MNQTPRPRAPRTTPFRTRTLDRLGGLERIASVGRWSLVAALALVVGCQASLPQAATSQPDVAPANSTRPTEAPATTLATRPVTPPFFKVESKRGATLLVLGTMHLGPPTGWVYSEAIERGLAEADAFVLEIDLRNATEESVSTVLAERVILPVSVTLDQVISPETAKLLDENETTLARLGMSRQARMRLEPWFIAVSLTEALSASSGLAAGQSVDSAILARSAGRPLHGLETFDAQLAMLDGLSRELKDAMLRDTVMRLDETAEEMRATALAWSRNDREKLFEIAYQGVDENPELADFYEILLTERNRNWAGQLGALLDDPARAGQTIFVGVGALHLVGPDSLITFLEARGDRVQALHPTWIAGSDAISTETGPSPAAPN